MIRLRHKVLIHALRLADQGIVLATLILFLSAVPMQVWTSDWRAAVGEPQPTDALALLVIGFASLAIFSHVVRYDVNRFTPLGTEIQRLLIASTGVAATALFCSFTFSLPRQPLLHTGALFTAMAAILIAVRYAAHQSLRVMRRLGASDRHVLIVGCNEGARSLARRFENAPALGYRVVGFVCESHNLPAPSGCLNASCQCLGTVDNLQNILRGGTVDEVAICTGLGSNFPLVTQVVRYCHELGIVVRLIPGESENRILEETQLEYFDGHYVVTIFREHLIFQLLVKRIFDVVVSTGLIALLSPLLLATALAVKATSRGPVLFVQERVGMNKRRFKLYKFRSMVVDAEARKKELAHLNEMDGPVFKIANDPRVTAVGRFIRRTSIDELPQLFNVLGGSMSLVGPRPPVPAEVEKYEWLFQQRLCIKPGITCLWQISGRNEITFREWMELDRRYIQNWSLWLDLKILVKTVPAVLFARGAS